MSKVDDWALGKNWVAVALLTFPLILTAFIVQQNKYEKLMRERTALMYEMTPVQIRRARKELSEYYEMKSMLGEVEHQ